MIRYRADIDGLRAIAVTAVVLEHTGTRAIMRGDLGVDVFFAISGYIITRVIVSEISAASFSLGNFYRRRIMRLLPALLAMIVVTLVLSIVLGGLPNSRLIHSLLSAMTSTANIYFTYTPAGRPPLDGSLVLPTWSLSVEEQFYLLYPGLLLLLSLRYGLQSAWVPGALSLILVASVAAISVLGRPETVLLPQYRGWELMFGAIIAFPKLAGPSSIRLANLICVSGLALICIALSGTLELPGAPNEFAPRAGAVLGTGMLLWAGEVLTATTRVLSLDPVATIGKLSYSLYLWHWPLFEFTRVMTGRGYDLGVKTSIMVGATSVLFAYASYRYVEGPLRGRTDPVSVKRVLAAYLCTMAGLVLYLTVS